MVGIELLPSPEDASVHLEKHCGSRPTSGEICSLQDPLSCVSLEVLRSVNNF